MGGRRRDERDDPVVFAIDEGAPVEMSDAASGLPGGSPGQAGPGTDPRGTGPRDPDGGDPDRGGPDRGGPDTQPARRRVPLWAVGLVVVGALGAMVVASKVNEQRLEQQLAEAGGVLPAPGEPTTLWTTDAERDGTSLPWDDTLVWVASDVSAIDPVTGEVRWTQDVGAAPVCGDPSLGTPGDWATALTCVSGEGAVRTITVLDREGAVVAQREVEAAPDDGVWIDRADAQDRPAGDGMLVSARRVGSPSAGERSAIAAAEAENDAVEAARAEAEASDADDPGDIELSVSTGVIEPFVPRDVEVTFADATTGDARATATLQATESGDECLSLRAAQGAQATLTLESAAILVEPAQGTVHVTGCGIDATFTPGGSRIDDPEQDDTVVELGDGTFQRMADGDVPGDVVDATGRRVWDPDGEVLVPGSTDGAADGTTLVHSSGGVITAHETDRTERWSLKTGAPGVLVQTADTAVLESPSAVFAIDLMTGTEIWRVSVGADTYVPQAFTDGEHVLVRTEKQSPSGTPNGRLAALALTTGSADWTVPLDLGTSRAVAVDGMLLVPGYGTISRLG